MVLDEVAVFVVAGALEEGDVHAHDFVELEVFVGVAGEECFEVVEDEFECFCDGEVRLFFAVSFVLFVHPSVECFADVVEGEFGLGVGGGT